MGRFPINDAWLLFVLSQAKGQKFKCVRASFVLCNVLMRNVLHYILVCVFWIMQPHSGDQEVCQAAGRVAEGGITWLAWELAQHKVWMYVLIYSRIKNNKN